MTGFWEDFEDGLKMPFQAVYNKFDKVDRASDRALDAGGKALDGAGNALEGLGNLLGGNSNILAYLGIGLVGVIVLPKIIDRVL